MKSRARCSWHRDLGSDFVPAFKSRSQIFKQGSRRLGESRILPFATPKNYMLEKNKKRLLSMESNSATFRNKKVIAHQ